ncbi:carbohydrate kinase family protein [candidate division KSB1 bacterium]|nr:carbohydrate kinase family protein [candidate division KSB1 bacterium]
MINQKKTCQSFQIKPARAREIFERIKKLHIGVIGDFCLDVYWAIDMNASEASIETGKKTLPVRQQYYSAGGAGNVTVNLVDLGVGHTSVFGAVGQDPFGQQLRLVLERKNINTRYLISCPASLWQTLVYIKPFVDNKEQSRFDMGNFNKLPDEITDSLFNGLYKSVKALDALIVNQQVKTGLHTVYFQTICAEFVRRFQEKLILFDSRDIQGRYPGAWMKMNENEVLRLAGRQSNAGDEYMETDVFHAAQKVYNRFLKPIFITRGASGCVVCDEQNLTVIPGHKIDAPVDTVGAGDTYLSAVAAALAAGATTIEAAQLANSAAAVTVKKLGQTGTASPQEILNILHRSFDE